MASRPTGQVVARGVNKWQVKIFLGRDETGKRSYFSSTVSGTKKDAQRVLTEKLRELHAGTFVKPTKATKQTLHTYLAEWVGSKKANARTLHDYRAIIRRYFKDHVIGRVRVDLLAPAGIRRFYLDLQEQGLSPRTVEYAHAVLHSALEQAVEDGLIPRNPAKSARKALDKVERSEKQVFTVQDARTFIEHARKDRYGALWLLLLDAGLRPAEALGLKWSDLDFDAALIRVQRSLKEPLGEGGTWRLERPKTKTAVRSVPIMPDTVQALREHRKRQIEERLAAGEDWGANTEPNLIFTTSAGTYVRQSNLHRRNFKPILKAAGLPDMRLYDLRHSAASILLALGENPKVVQERLGHRDVGMTLNTYSHMLEGLQQQATARMAQALQSV